MNICMYYIMSEEIVPRWNRTVALQKKMLPEWESIPKVFIADRNLSIPVPGDKITTDLFEDTVMRFPMAKNLGLRWALDKGYEWVVDCDSDTVILKMPSRNPSTGYSTVLCYQSRQQESDEDLVRMYETGKMKFDASSRFILRNDVFSKYIYDESIVSWGWDDIDYHFNVLMANGVFYEHSGAIGIHIWHHKHRVKEGNGHERYLAKRAISKLNGKT